MSGMFFLNPENLPPEIREQIEKQHDLHHMSHQQHIHEVNDFFRSLNKEQAVTLHTLVGHIIDGTAEDNERGAYYLGRISEHLMLRHGVCICGVDHDKEHEELVAQEAEPKRVVAEDYVKDLAENAPSRNEAHEMLERHVRRMGEAEGWKPVEIAAAVADGKRMLDDLNKNVAAEADPNPEHEVEREVADQRNLEMYHVMRIPLSNEVVCATPNCGRRWMNLEDRMLGKQGKGGCDFCTQREKWG